MEQPPSPYTPSSVGSDRSPQQWPQLFLSAPKETDLGSMYQSGPSCGGLCLACKTVGAAAFMRGVMDDGKKGGTEATDGHPAMQVKAGRQVCRWGMLIHCPVEIPKGPRLRPSGPSACLLLEGRALGDLFKQSYTGTFLQPPSFFLAPQV